MGSAGWALGWRKGRGGGGGGFGPGFLVDPFLESFVVDEGGLFAEAGADGGFCVGFFWFAHRQPAAEPAAF